jgi:hypothetical protein
MTLQGENIELSVIESSQEPCMSGEEIVRIENWYLVSNADGDKSAVSVSYRLRGDVYGHPQHKEGERLTTSEITSLAGNIVRCKSRTYYLGNPSKKYLESLQEDGFVYDIANPIPQGVGTLS